MGEDIEVEASGTNMELRVNIYARGIYIGGIFYGVGGATSALSD